MGILSWLIFGVIAGIVSKNLMPGPSPGGLVATIGLGIFGALLGGFIGVQLGVGNLSGFDLRSMVLAVGGGVILLAAYRIAAKKGLI